MGSKTTSSYTMSLFLMLIASMLIHSPPCVARFPPETKSVAQIQNYEPQFLDGISAALQPCLAALGNTGGCVGELYRFTSGQDTKFRDVCCKSMIQIDDDCWAKILPSQPFFPTMINSYCSTLLRGAPGGLPAGGAVGGGPGGVVGGGAGGALPTPP